MKKFAIILSIFLLVACAEKTDRTEPESADEIVARIEKLRNEKDLSFKRSPNSPLPDEVKADFQGLSYFPIDLKYRYKLPLHRYDNPEKFQIVTSRGVQRAALKYGFFRFQMGDEDCVLQVYKLLDIQKKYPDLLFVPFLDASSGDKTYSGGRYIDLHENESGYYTLDFNLAYNPSCAYGKDSYNCPIPPAENRLPVAMPAGEKYQAYHSE